MKKIHKLINPIKEKFGNTKKKASLYIRKNPTKSFYLALSLLVFFIIVGNIFRTPKAVEKKEVLQKKNVKIFSLGSTTSVSVVGKIDKSGVIQIMAQTSGVVSKINVTEGKKVKRGATLVNLSSNYQGGNAPALQRNISSLQYQNVLETYDAQKDLLLKQKDIAGKTDENSDKLAEIIAKSHDDTKSLISLNENILQTIDSNLKKLETDPITNEALILSTKQLKSQFLSAQNQSRSALRQSEYQTSSDQSPAKMSDLQREIAQNQLDTQLKMLDLNKQVSRIQLSLANVSAGLMLPSAPFSGTVQKIFVRVGQLVNPGTPLMVLSQIKEEDPITATAYVTLDIAQKISKTEPAILHINNKEFKTTPTYVSTDAVMGELYGVYFAIPDSYNEVVTDKATIKIDLTLKSDTNVIKPYIPLDATYQSNNGAYIYVVENNKAVSKKIKLGQVYGSLVEVSGLSESEKVIIDRTVVDGTPVVIVK